MKKIYGYARVSTREQHLDRQIKALRDHGIEERDIVTDHASGASLERLGYTALKGTMLRDGDTLVVKSLDRLSRNKEHIIQELNIIIAVIQSPLHTIFDKFLSQIHVVVNVIESDFRLNHPEFRQVTRSI